MCLSMSQGRIKLPQQQRQRQQRQEEDEEFKRKQTTFLFKHNEIVIYSFISLWSFRLHTVVVIIIIIRVLQEQLRRQSVSQVIVIGPAIMGLHKRLKLLLLMMMVWLIHPTPSHSKASNSAHRIYLFHYFHFFTHKIFYYFTNFNTSVRMH